MHGKTWFALVAFGVLALSPLPATGGSDLRVADGHVLLTAPAALGVKSTDARRVHRHAMDALRLIKLTLGLVNTEVFAQETVTPMWFVTPGKPKAWITVELQPQIPFKDLGFDRYLDRLRQGRPRLLLPTVAGRPGPDQRGLIWREMTAAILARSINAAAPLWLREGLAEAMGEEGANGEGSRIELTKDVLRDSIDDFSVETLLSTTDRETWARAGGRALSWAICRVLLDCAPDVIPGLIEQSRRLLLHLMDLPEEEKLLAEYTLIMREQLIKAGGDVELLQKSVKEWVEADFVTREAKRKGKSIRRLRGLTTPKAFPVQIFGGFLTTAHYEDMTADAFFGKIVADWGLPFTSQIEIWVGVRGKPGTNFILRPEAKEDGVQCMLVSFQAKQRDTRRILNPEIAYGIMLDWQRYKCAFVVLISESPLGIRYQWIKERKIK